MRQPRQALGITSDLTVPEGSPPASLSLARLWRQAAGLFFLLLFLARALVGGAARSLLLGRRFDAKTKARWLQSLCQAAARVLRLEVVCEGEPPSRGLVVSNHLGYLDILALGSTAPLVFLSKREVKGWPLVGAITQMAGALFIDRDDKRETTRLARRFDDLVGAGNVVVVFPEGTSSDGRQVLPFRSGLLEPAVRGRWPVTPAWIGYAIDDGSVEDEVCYWRDMTFFPHLLNLLGKKGVRAFVRFGPPVQDGGCRKELALRLQGEVRRLGDRHLRAASQAGGTQA